MSIKKCRIKIGEPTQLKFGSLRRGDSSSAEWNLWLYSMTAPADKTVLAVG